MMVSSVNSINFRRNPVHVDTDSLLMTTMGIDAKFNANHDVFLYLYTRKNQRDAKKITSSTSSISLSNFNPANPTRILIHGYMNGLKNDFYDQGVRTYLSHGDYNVVSLNSRAQ